MTYYELIKFLYSIEDKPIDRQNVEYLNSINIKLEDERYQRFLEQLSVVISDRIANAINRFREALISESLDSNTLAIHISGLKNEIKYSEELATCLLVKEENQKEFIDSIIKTNNSLADTIMTLFDDDERRSIISSLYIKEEA